MCRYSLLQLLFLFGYFCAFVECALMLTQATVNKDFPNSCWNEQEGKAFEVGESWVAPCVRFTCINYKEELFVEMAGCGKIAVPAGCKTVSNMTANYPLCCPQMTCSYDEVTLGPEYEEFTSWVNEYYDDPTTTNPETLTEAEGVEK